MLHLFCFCSIIIANEVKLILYCKRRQEIIIENIDLSTDKMEMVLAKQLKSGISFNLIKQSIKNAEIDSYLKEIRESNQNYNARIENIRLKNLVEILKKENSKISKAKNLLSEYKDAMKEKDNEIEELRRNNQDLYNCIQGLPKIIKKLFIKNTDIKLLK